MTVRCITLPSMVLPFQAMSLKRSPLLKQLEVGKLNRELRSLTDLAQEQIAAIVGGKLWHD